MNKKHIVILITVVVALLMMATCSYAKGPWKGRVIDAETKQPIEGAAVVAVWKKVLNFLPPGPMDMYLDAEETVTDTKGEFVIPSKWFISIPFFRKVTGPRFTIFKPGYGSFPEHQVFPKYTPIELFEGKGVVVELPKLNLKTREERLKYLPGTPYGMDGHENKMSQFKRLLDEEIRSINSSDIK